ncbi:serine/threonine phosphatase 7 [Prunus dulcis]|uniref:Serine/threonine-protein phosphatase n=1 Tax=Prunus dulcis TaxID=3755 RepID=A0A4Y1RI58_PRUDU|nr:serine/threonine phosphatase 7 [Prunus dulcis]
MYIWLIGFGFIKAVEGADMEARAPDPAPHTPNEPLNNLVRWPITEELREAINRMDVLLITGMPIDGRPVIGRLGKTRRLFLNAFGIDPPPESLDGGGLGLVVRPDEDGWAYYLRAYVMYVIGSYLIPDDSTGLVSAHYLGLLDNLQEVGSFAWGAAAWASLHNSLDRGIVNGLAYALMVFAIEHIEPLRIEVIGDIVDLPMECPLMVPWSHLLHKRLNANTVPNFGAYMEILGNATDENFIQQPYQRLSHTLLGEGYERYAPQLAKACSVALCINYHTVVPHKPNNFARQFGFENINLDSIPELPDVVVEVRKKGPKRDLNLANHGHFPLYINSWLGRFPLRGMRMAGLVGPPYTVELLAHDVSVQALHNDLLHSPHDLPVQALHDDPPHSSPSIASNLESEDNPSSQSPQLQTPIGWPLDGKLTLNWVQNLMSVFDWASRNLEPAQLPDVFPVEVFDSLALFAAKILHKEANCVTIDNLAPESTVVVVGDLHGQLHDLLFLLHDAGFPSENRFFVFNGDYVDRGAWGLESFLILLAWKVLMPKRVYLLRGNHESKYCTSVYGFEKEVLTKYGDRGRHVYCKCLRCFEDLPLASLIGKHVYTAHGGLFRHMPAISKKSKGKKSWRAFNREPSSLSLGSIEELNKARRSVLDPPWEGPNVIPGDVLWSDPSMSLGLSPNIERGIGLLWGPDCTEDFLKNCPDAREKRPGLGGMDEGYTIDHIVESGKLITLFSAPDYPQFQSTEERYKNKGAYIILEPPNFDDPAFHSFEAITPRPKADPFYNFEEVIDSDEELDLASMRCQRKCLAEKGAHNRIENLKIIVDITLTGGLLVGDGRAKRDEILLKYSC